MRVRVCCLASVDAGSLANKVAKMPIPINPAINLYAFDQA